MADSKTEAANRRRSIRLVKKVEYLHDKTFTSSESESDDGESECNSEDMEVDSEDEGNSGKEEDTSSDDEVEHVQTRKRGSAFLAPTSLSLGVKSSSALSSAQFNLEPFNPESYLLAENRMRFKSKKTQKEPPNDSKRGRKPKKGTRGLGGQKPVENLPERIKSNFSITKEAIRASGDLKNFGISDTKHGEEIKRLMAHRIIPDFPRWMFYMKEGYNIMLHGFGSKLEVIDKFKEYIGDEWVKITINGLAPKILARQILIKFCEASDFSENVEIKGTNIDILTEQVCRQLPMKAPHVFIFIQNFDALALNHPNVLTVVSCLAEISWVHIIATSDNVNACLGVTHSQAVQLNFSWVECSNFQRYSDPELRQVPNIFGESKGLKGTEITLQYVLKSLTGNARKAFSILASLQLRKIQGFSKSRKGKEKDFSGVEFAELARKCRESFIAHNDTALKTLLVEFVDHKLVTRHQGKNKGVNVTNTLTIDLDVEVLEKIVKDGV